MLKPLKKEPIGSQAEPIASNRTINVIDNADGSFAVLVTDRDYLNDPGGHSQTIVFNESFRSIDAAKVEVKRQVDSSRAEGFIDNKLSMI